MKYEFWGKNPQDAWASSKPQVCDQPLAAASLFCPAFPALSPPPGRPGESSATPSPRAGRRFPKLAAWARMTSMVVFYALFSALLFGSADFLGGLSSRQNSPLTVTAWAQIAGMAAVIVALPLLGVPAPPVGDLLWGAAAGLSGTAGIVLLFRGLASGYASVVSPAAALTGAVLPVLFGLLAGERPPVLTWAGVALALPAILLLSLETSGKNNLVLKSLRMGFLAGAAFSGFFILIARTGGDSGMWPLLAARVTTVPLLFFFILIRGEKPILGRGTGRVTLLSGFLDMAANVFYVLAFRAGYLILAVVLTALYPAPTVFLQRLILGEELTTARIIGLILSIAGAALIGIGG